MPVEFNQPRVPCGNPNCNNMVAVRDAKARVGFCNRICFGEAKRHAKYKGMNASTLGQVRSQVPAI